MKFIIFLTCSLLLVGGVNGQQGSPFTCSLNYLPVTKDDVTNQIQTQVALNIPVFKNNSFTGLTGTSFKYYQLSFEKDTLNIKHLYSWSFPITLQIKIYENKYLTFIMEPMLSSGFNDLKNNALRYNFAALFLKKEGQYHTGFGLAVSKRFSGYQIAPMWIVNYRLGQHWVISGTIPFKTKIAYEINSKIQVGINLGANTNSFRLNEDNQGYYIDYQSIEASLFYQHSILKNVRLNFGFGAQSLQSKVYNNHQTAPFGIFLIYPNNSHEPIETYINKGMVLLQLGVSYAIP